MKKKLTDKDIRTLKKKWQGIHRRGEFIEFADFDDFCQWCAGEGYEYGKILRRRNGDEPYTRDNLFFDDADACGNVFVRKQLEERWDRCVGPFREKHRKEIEAIRNRDSSTVRQYWRYEHPDLVREGLTFLPSDC